MLRSSKNKINQDVIAGGFVRVHGRCLGAVSCYFSECELCEENMKKGSDVVVAGLSAVCAWSELLKNNQLRKTTKIRKRILTRRKYLYLLFHLRFLCLFSLIVLVPLFSFFSSILPFLFLVLQILPRWTPKIG